MAKASNSKKSEVVKTSSFGICGIVMPISEIDGCSEGHWIEVNQIIPNSIRQAGFEPNMVSMADEIGVIQKRIIQNLYDNPIIVCDVSGKNPNVMFELGMRLAFDKPTVIIKDDKTSYTFDTGVVEHLEYPRDLRFHKMVEFQERLTSRIIGTYEKADKDPEYSTFLKSFGEFKIAKIEHKIVPEQEFIFEELRSIRELLTDRGAFSRSRSSAETYEETSILVPPDLYVDITNVAERHRFSTALTAQPGVKAVEKMWVNDALHLLIYLTKGPSGARALTALQTLFPDYSFKRWSYPR